MSPPHLFLSPNAAHLCTLLTDRIYFLTERNSPFGYSFFMLEMFIKLFTLMDCTKKKEEKHITYSNKKKTDTQDVTIIVFNKKKREKLFCRLRVSQKHLLHKILDVLAELDAWKLG